MSFQRARSEKKKQSRIDDIVRIAAEIFDRDGFENLNFFTIAEKAGLTRPAIYRYFSSKEAILLKAIVRDFDDWAWGLLASFSLERSYEAEEVAEIWTQSILAHERMLKLYSIHNTILENNLPMDSLIDFEESFHRSMQLVKELLGRLFPRATREQTKNFLDVQLALAFGFYLTCRISPAHMEAAKRANTSSAYPSFEASLKNNIFSLLRFLE